MLQPVMARGRRCRQCGRRGQPCSCSTRCRPLGALTRKIDQLVDRIVATDSPSAVKAYEGKLRALEEQRTSLTEKIASCGRSLPDFDETFRTGLEFLSSPSKIRSSGDTHQPRAVQKSVFAEGPAYSRNAGFRTAPTSSPFRLLPGSRTRKEVMARPEGFEPPTPRFVVWCSIQLSYGRAVGGDIGGSSTGRKPRLRGRGGVARRRGRQ
jgi:site-specific DNA recombinase